MTDTLHFLGSPYLLRRLTSLSDLTRASPKRSRSAQPLVRRRLVAATRVKPRNRVSTPLSAKGSLERSSRRQVRSEVGSGLSAPDLACRVSASAEPMLGVDDAVGSDDGQRIRGRLLERPTPLNMVGLPPEGLPAGVRAGVVAFQRSCDAEELRTSAGCLADQGSDDAGRHPWVTS